MQNRIYSIDNAKASKAQHYGYLNAIHYMAPHTLAGVGNLCPHSTPACREVCLGWFSGHAAMVKDEASLNSVRRSRISKARRFMQERPAYLADMVSATESILRKAHARSLIPAVRCDGSTDIGWERIPVVRNSTTFPNIMTAFPTIQFLDYTKNPNRFKRPLPSNYHLTFSASESNQSTCLALLAQGINVAKVFHTLPSTFMGFPVIDGDLHDLRHLDPKGVWVGLTPKGRKAKADNTFVS